MASRPSGLLHRLNPPTIVVGTVTVIHQGNTAGIWSMATDRTRQRSGIGRRLLSTAMAEARRLGARRFFPGATPAGYRLDESMGFATRVVTKVWASGKPIRPKVRTPTA